MVTNSPARPIPTGRPLLSELLSARLSSKLAVSGAPGGVFAEDDRWPHCDADRRHAGDVIGCSDGDSVTCDLSSEIVTVIQDMQLVNQRSS